METYAIGLGALIVSIGTAIFAVLSARRKANGADVERQDRRLERVERELDDCQRERARLERREILLMRQLIEARLTPNDEG